MDDTLHNINRNPYRSIEIRYHQQYTMPQAIYYLTWYHVTADLRRNAQKLRRHIMLIKIHLCTNPNLTTKPRKLSSCTQQNSPAELE